MFGGKTHDGKTNETYIGHCTISSIVSSNSPTHCLWVWITCNFLRLGKRSIHHQELVGLIIDMVMVLQYWMSIIY